MDILILALISVFILYRLYSLLGQKHDIEKEEFEAKVLAELRKIHESEFKPKPKSLIPLDLPNDLVAVLSEVSSRDENFDYEEFLNNVKIVFEIVVKAYANNDKATLKPLLVDRLYSDFVREMDALYNSSKRLYVTIVKLDSPQIISGIIEDDIVSLTIKFISKQIIVIKDENGKIISGSISREEDVTDIWVFSRYLKSTDLGWKLLKVIE